MNLTPPTLFLALLVFSGTTQHADTATSRQTAEEWTKYIEIDENPEAVRERFRSEGIPTNFAELLGERPPDNENGWILLSEWIEEYRKPIDEASEFAEQILEESSDLERNPDWENSALPFLTDPWVQEAMKVLQTTLYSPEWFPIRNWDEGFSMIIPEVGSMRRLGLVLSVAQRYSLTHPEQSPWTSKELFDLQMRLARRSSDEPHITSFLTGLALLRIPQNDARWFYSEFSSIPRMPTLDIEFWQDQLSNALTGERLTGEISFQQVRDGDESLLSWLGVLDEPSGLSDLITLWLAKFLIYQSASTDEDQYMKMMEMARQVRSDELLSKVVHQYKIDDPISIPSILVPAIGNLEISLQKRITAFNAWLIAFELEEYRSENKQYPPNLETLSIAKPVLETFHYLPGSAQNSYILYPLNPDLAEDALEDDQSVLVWFSPNLSIEEVQQLVEGSQ
ncbi:hypothetical protein [Puniceicoccus vermicola]|uniref:DUF4034 domain-containing protein n=1 Tax=Puniceicoccus vermicola TaxID=388746 RepID=A0A7X1AYH5_9BACT|nr:hypothetical protein [Puniceicoccus vermicola]MBC2601155.1 hypothetical protein [Puniceicoccus vermicola]